jgi:hypothetical protein
MDSGLQQMDHTPHGGFLFVLVATIPKSNMLFILIIKNLPPFQM